jgi:hypothetical protein
LLAALGGCLRAGAVWAEFEPLLSVSTLFLPKYQR